MCTAFHQAASRRRARGWTFWRDLHACVAVWFSLLFVGFLLTALPWTHCWGGSILGPMQQRLGQAPPPAAGFAPVFEGHGDVSQASLQRMVDPACRHGLRGDLMLCMVDGPPGSAVSVRNVAPRASQERFLLLDRGEATVREQTDGARFPLVARTVATGVKMHEGEYFGRLGPWVNTAFAAARVWLSISGLLDAQAIARGERAASRASPMADMVANHVPGGFRRVAAVGAIGGGLVDHRTHPGTLRSCTVGPGMSLPGCFSECVRLGCWSVHASFALAATAMAENAHSFTPFDGTLTAGTETES